MQCLDITCLCMLSFLLKDFSQTDQNQLMSTPQEQNVDYEKGRMLLIYIGLANHENLLFSAFSTRFILFPSTTLAHFYCFPSPPPPPLPHFYCFPPPPPPDFYCFLFPPPPPPHLVIFPLSNSIKDQKLPQLVHFVAMSQVVKNNCGFLQLLAVCPAHQR